MLATIQGIMAKHGMPSPLMNPKHDTGLKFEADPPQSQR
jgi:hypothetical protein